jgi:transposase-like protein
MKNETTLPKTLIDAVKYFADPDAAQAYFVKIRWPKGVACPHCGSRDVHYLANQRRWKCKKNHPKRQFSAKVGTIFEESPLPLEKWLVAVWLETNAKNSISSYEVARALGITQKSAWFMLHRVRLALKSGSLEKMGGSGSPVEVDETFIGGKWQNMSLARRRKNRRQDTGSYNKAIVAGLLERGIGKKKSRVATSIVERANADSLLPVIHKNVEKGARVFTDEARHYQQMPQDFVHFWVNHMHRYVVGEVHTNSIENFWALFKRCIKGTHVSVDPAHLKAYVDSEAFRFNNRDTSDSGRHLLALGGVIGKRLTYAALTGALEDRSANGRGGANA